MEPNYLENPRERSTAVSPAGEGPYPAYVKEYPDFKEVTTEQDAFESGRKTATESTTTYETTATVEVRDWTTPDLNLQTTEPNERRNDAKTPSSDTETTNYRLSTVLTIPVLRQKDGIVRKSDVTIAKIGPYAALIVPTDQLKEYSSDIEQMPRFPIEIAESVKSFVRFSNYEPPDYSTINEGPVYPPSDDASSTSSLTNVRSSFDAVVAENETNNTQQTTSNSTKALSSDVETTKSTIVSNEIPNDNSSQLVTPISGKESSNATTVNMSSTPTYVESTSTKPQFDRPLQVSDVLLYLSTASIKNDLSNQQRREIASLFDRLLLSGGDNDKQDDNRIVAD